MVSGSQRIVTEDVDALGAFYERLTGTAPVGMKDYIELRLPGPYLAICSRRSVDYMHGGDWKGGTNRSVIVEFEVEDVDAERLRLADFVTYWIQEPKDMPWATAPCCSAIPTATRSTCSGQQVSQD